VPTNGTYHFETNLEIKIPDHSFPLGQVTCTVELVHANSSSVEISKEIKTDWSTPNGNTLNIKVDKQFICTTADKIFVRLKIQSQAMSQSGTVRVFFNKSYFSCIFSDIDGGAWQPVDATNFYPRKYTFSKNISLTDFKAILANKSYALLVNHCDNPNEDKQAWIESIKYNVTSGKADFNLISK